MAFLVGAASQFGNGKDVFCNYLCQQLNKNCKYVFENDQWSKTNEWRRAAFASKVKEVFMSAFGVNFDFIEEWKRKDMSPPGYLKTIRESLTFIGDGFRHIVPTIWIDQLLKNNKDNLIISDVRYINESNYIRDNNGITVLLWRPGFENDFPSKSEQELMPFVKSLKETKDGEIMDPKIPFDLWIKNDGTLDDLYAKVDKVVVPYIEKFIMERSRCC